MISARAVVMLGGIFVAPAMVLGAACSSDPPGIVGIVPEGAAPGPDAEGGFTTVDASDSATDAPASTCEGACKTTSLVADFGGKTRTLVRAQFGTQGDGGAELHTESHLGGSAACPTQGSPTPDYTLLVTPIPRGAAGQKLSDRDRVTSNFFDFKGDLGLAAPSGITKAISVDITVVAEDPSTPPKWVALDVRAGFREGAVSGHLYAEYCQSLSE